MPTYQYVCTDCGERLEIQQSFSDEALTVCPTCQGRLRKVFGAVGVVFKGSGFYRNDSRPAESTGSSDGDPKPAAAKGSGSESAKPAAAKGSGSESAKSTDAASSNGGKSGGKSERKSAASKDSAA